MKSLYKNSLIVIIVIATIISLWFILKPKPVIPIKNVSHIVKLQHDTTVHITDLSGKKHAENTVITDPNREVVLAFYQDSIHKLAQQLRLKDNQINQFGTIVTSLNERLKAKVIVVDSTKNQLQIQAGDNYIKIFGIVKPKDSTSFLDYLAKDTLHYVFFNKKQNIFQKLTQIPEQKFDVMSSNPKMIISNVSSVIIPPAKPSRFKLGLYGGYGLQLNTKTNSITAGPQLGAGILYNF